MTILIVMNLGFAWGAGSPVPPPPYSVDAQQAYSPGSAAVDIFTRHTAAAQGYEPGTQNAQPYGPGTQAAQGT